MTILIVLIGLPLAVLLAKPVRGWASLKRFLLLVALGYVALNAGLYTHRAIVWQIYESCQSQFPDGLIQHHPECTAPNIRDGASNIFYLYLGWLPVAIYTGFWMLAVGFCRFCIKAKQPSQST